MADNSFLDFNFKVPVPGDYLVGYNADGSTELKTTVQQFLTLSETYTLSSRSPLWDSIASFVQANSATWEESADILPTVTDYLSTQSITVSTLNVTEQLLSANNNLFDIFLTPANTLTTSICAMSGDGATPFIMQFTNGLLTSITF